MTDAVLLISKLEVQLSSCSADLTRIEIDGMALNAREIGSDRISFSFNRDPNANPGRSEAHTITLTDRVGNRHELRFVVNIPEAQKSDGFFDKILKDVLPCIFGKIVGDVLEDHNGRIIGKVVGSSIDILIREASK